MLSWIKQKRSNHPMEGVQDAKQITSDLTALEPFQALGHISGYLDAIKTSVKLSPSRAVDITDALDKAARVPQRRLNYDYVTLGRKLTRFQDTRIWSTVHAYWTQLAEAYLFCLSAYEVGALGSQALKPHLPKLIARAIRARGQQLKWALLRYELVEPRVWEDLAKLYAMAEACGIHDRQIQLYRAGQQDSSVQAEFLRAMMLGVSATGTMLPIQIEIADRLIARCTEGFEIHEKQGKGLQFVVDLATSPAPGRISTGTRSSSASRYFGATRASRQVLTPLIGNLGEYKQIPRDLNLGIHPNVDTVLDTIRHLASHWSAEPPRRASVRRHRTEKITVVHDYDEVVANAGGLFLEYPFVSNDEPWSLENESGTGFGAVVAKPHGKWLRAGGLIAIRHEDCAAWCVAVIRRVSADRKGNRTVGAQRLCQGGTAVTVTSTRPSAPSLQSADALSPQEEICVLLPSSGEARSSEVNLLMRPGLFVPGRNLEMRAYERRYILKPLKMILRGEDFELARLRIEASLT
jgi:hypothetical protein